MCDWGFCAGLAATFPGDRPVSLLPQCHTIASTNLFRVLEKTCRSGDDPTCNSAGERERKNTLTNLKQKKKDVFGSPIVLSRQHLELASRLLKHNTAMLV